MDEEKRTCKTCHQFNEDAYFCRALDSNMAEWDTCKDHKTYDELKARVIENAQKTSEGKLALVEAHRDRLWKAMGEIEDRMKSHQMQLEGMYNQNLWIPVKEKRETDSRAQPEYFDGLADWVDFLRPIIYGAK